MEEMEILNPRHTQNPQTINNLLPADGDTSGHLRRCYFSPPVGTGTITRIWVVEKDLVQIKPTAPKDPFSDNHRAVNSHPRNSLTSMWSSTQHSCQPAFRCSPMGPHCPQATAHLGLWTQDPCNVWNLLSRLCLLQGYSSKPLGFVLLSCA